MAVSLRLKKKNSHINFDFPSVPARGRHCQHEPYQNTTGARGYQACIIKLGAYLSRKVPDTHLSRNKTVNHVDGATATRQAVGNVRPGNVRGPGAHLPDADGFAADDGDVQGGGGVAVDEVR